MIEINKKKVDVDENMSIAEIIRSQGKSTSGIAVALNNQVVKANELENSFVKEGDSLTVIKAFYGG